MVWQASGQPDVGTAIHDDPVPNPNLESEQSMNERPKNFLAKLSGTLVSVLLATSPQTTSAQNEDLSENDVYELNPFEVSSSEDVGYLATTTLAGTRIKTDLRDIGASISVYTQEFLEDTGSTNIEELLVYATGTEVDGINGNFSSAGNVGNFGTVDFGTVTLSEQTPTRIRGLANADRTRNYYGSIIPFDSYNIDRVLVNRGANNILFGLGSPAGIINHTLARPLSVDRNRLRIRADDYGTLRGQVDVNRVLVEDRVNVRVTALHNEQRFQQDEAFNNESRIYGAFDAWLTESTLFRVNVESGDMKSTPPLNAPIRDRFSNWWDFGQPTIPLGTYQRDSNSAAGVPGGTFDGTVVPLSRIAALFYDDVSPSIGFPPLWQTNPNDMFNANLNNVENGFDSNNPEHQESFAPLFATMNDSGRRIRQVGNVPPTIEDGFAKSPQLQDPTTFDYFNDLLDGRKYSKMARLFCLQPCASAAIF